MECGKETILPRTSPHPRLFRGELRSVMADLEQVSARCWTGDCIKQGFRCPLQDSLFYFLAPECFLVTACFFLEITLMSLVIVSLDTSLHSADTSCDLLGSSAIALALERSLICHQSPPAALNLLADPLPLLQALCNWLYLL